MEPKQQVEIQLGHMCNNRCLFCVSGQRTEMREAHPMAAQPLLDKVSEAWDRGHRKLTLLGGEPTLQPGFMDVVRHAVSLGFEEIVIFTNGVKISRDWFIDRLRATGGNFTWRISIQGATKDSHERTTRKSGSFDRILAAMSHLRDRRERITVNMCVVSSNYESVDHFPELLPPYGVQQLHLDMMRPLDAGIRTEEEMRAMIPRYSDMAAPLTRMVEGFPEGFDVNIGNLPYCIAPHLAPWIHHDGEQTDTVAIDEDDQLSEPWDKYEVKRRDKDKPGSCAQCVFEDRCSGVFDTYARFYGTEELVPIRHAQLAEIDPRRRLLSLHLRPLAERLRGLEAGEGFGPATVEERGEAEVHLSLSHPAGALAIAFRPPETPGAFARYEGFGLHLLSAPAERAPALAGLRAVGAALEQAGERPVCPVGDDALGLPARSVAVRLGRLRAAAPFGELRWTEVRCAPDGMRAELSLDGPSGERATVWLAEQGKRATGGYRLDAGEPTEALVDGLRAVMAVVGAPRATAVAAE